MLSDRDRKLIEALEFDPGADKSFDVMRDCLVWDDERPKNLTPAGYEFLGDLWIVRGFLHRGVGRERWGPDPSYFERSWEHARSIGLRWPGFQRLTLSEADRAFLEKWRADPDPL